jgi:SAM-dependent methyltransferase
MSDIPNVNQVKTYFQDRLSAHGATPRGADWNSTQAQEVRFEQLLKVVDFSQPFCLLDYGCGYGALIETLAQRGSAFEYLGYDVLESMVEKARELHQARDNCRFSSRLEDLGQADFAVISGVFNIRFDTPVEEWTQYVLRTLNLVNQYSRRGFSFNMLTRYSDAEYMKPHLYYADPCFFFGYCKQHFSRNVALLHDYELYDFTVLVRK